MDNYVLLRSTNSCRIWHVEKMIYMILQIWPIFHACILCEICQVYRAPPRKANVGHAKSLHLQAFKSCRLNPWYHVATTDTKHWVLDSSGGMCNHRLLGKFMKPVLLVCCVDTGACFSTASHTNTLLPVCNVGDSACNPANTLPRDCCFLQKHIDITSSSGKSCLPKEAICLHWW